MLLDARKKALPYSPYVNTGTIYDLYTGKFRPSTTGGWILDGGLSNCLGISGRAQTYKSGLAGSLVSRALTIHPQAEAFIYETEGTISDPTRYDDFISGNVSNRILFTNHSIGSLTEFYDTFTGIIEDKLKDKSKYLVDSQFVNPLTGKPHKVWIPTFVLVDSFSRARSDSGDKKFEDNSIDDSSMNTFWLHEGNVKTRIMNDLPIQAAKAGVYAVMTAHVGNKQDLDPYNRSPKQLQYMKNSDKMKNVGSNFEFLTTTLLQTIKATVLQNKDKTCMYPNVHSTDVEVNMVDTMLVRCKNNASGNQVPFVVSQFQGILDEITNFNILLSNKNYGLTVKGNNQGFTPLLAPNDTILTKKNIRDVMSVSYESRRGLQLLTEMCFIQNYWSTWGMPDYVKIAPEKVAEALSRSEKCSIDRILKSTGTWSTSKQDRELFTVMDILQFIDSETKKTTVIDMASTKPIKLAA